MQTIRLDPDNRRAWREGEELRLSRKEFDLLHTLIRSAGDIVSRDELMRVVWNTSFWTSSKTIDVHLGWLRRKIGDDARRPHLITTIRGRGLRFELTASGRGPGGAHEESAVESLTVTRIDVDAADRADDNRATLTQAAMAVHLGAAASARSLPAS